jgi:hypothetical protein
MTKFIEMTLEEWKEKYKPIDELGNTVDKPNTDKPNTVWTLYATDGYEWINSGIGMMNAVGYYECEIPYDDDEDIEISIKEGDDSFEYLKEYEVLQEDGSIKYVYPPDW